MITLLFNPFTKLAGAKALYIGLAAIIMTAIIAYFSHTRFDGILDVHYSADLPLKIYFLDGFLNLITLIIVFFLISLLVSKTSVRIIDIAGTMAISRLPMLFVALIGLIIKENETALYLSWKVLNIGEEVSLHSGEILVFIIAIILILGCVIWSVALMYNALKVSANLKGQRATISFIIGLFLSEIIVKIILYASGNLTLTYVV